MKNRKGEKDKTDCDSSNSVSNNWGKKAFPIMNEVKMEKKVFLINEKVLLKFTLELRLD